MFVASMLESSCTFSTLQFCASYAPSTLLEEIGFEGSIIQTLRVYIIFI
ncbi:MAG: hypothetical protein LBS83_02390 [Holosporales bacterium]|nr:hypothetical protein [Holosporales bacterium]